MSQSDMVNPIKKSMADRLRSASDREMDKKAGEII